MRSTTNNSDVKRSRKPRNRNQRDTPVIRDIGKLEVWRDIPPRMPRPPRGPSPGALLTTRQFASNFTVSTNVSSGVITQAGSTAVLGAIAFTLADLPQVSTFSSMFDQYRFEKVKLRFFTRNSYVTTRASNSPNQALPLVFVAIDRDDSSAPSLLSDLQQYDNCVCAPATTSVDVDLVPSITPSVFASGAFSGYEVKRSDQVWIDIANTSVPNYGVKFGITALQVSSTDTWAWDVQAWYTVSFRNTR